MKQAFWQRSRQFSVLVAFKALAELRSERQRTYLGFLWWFFEPAFFMLVFYFVFSVLMKRGGPNYVAVLLSGLVLWQWFNNAIMHCSTSIQNALPLVRSVQVPPAMFPLATLLADSAKFAVVFVVLMLVLTMLGHPPNFAYIALPFVLAAEFALICGGCLVVAAIIPFVPDLRFVIAPLLQGMFFLSAVFFTFDSVSAEMRHLLNYNPMAVIIDSGRDILLHGRVPDLIRLAKVQVFGIILLAFGAWLVGRLAHRYPKLTD